MSNMDRAHQKNAVSQPRRIFIAGKNGPMHRRRLADHDRIPDDQLSYFRICLEMLRRQPHKRRRADLTILPNDGPPLHMRVFMDNGAGADSHRALDDAVCTD